MASILMHLCASNILKEKYNFSDKFLVGSALPDLLKKIPPFTRDLVHYIKIVDGKHGIKKIPDLERFVNKNVDKLKIKDECTLGYFAHLMQDKIWFDIFVPKYAETLKNDMNKVLYVNDNEVHMMEEYEKISYLDYMNLEKYILNKYSLDKHKIKRILMNNINDENIKDVLDNEIRSLPYIEDRVNVFFTNDDVDEFISLSIEEFDKFFTTFFNEISDIT